MKFWFLPRALAMLAAFATMLTIPAVVRVLAPASGCRSDCPMHAKKLRCHGTDESRCPSASSSVVLRSENCMCGTSHGTFAGKSDLALTKQVHNMAWLVPGEPLRLYRPSSVPDRAPDPPFRPPAA